MVVLRMLDVYLWMLSRFIIQLQTNASFTTVRVSRGVCCVCAFMCKCVSVNVSVNVNVCVWYANTGTYSLEWSCDIRGNSTFNVTAEIILIKSSGCTPDAYQRTNGNWTKTTRNQRTEEEKWAGITEWQTHTHTQTTCLCMQCVSIWVSLLVMMWCDVCCCCFIWCICCFFVIVVCLFNTVIIVCY